jgi:hypothetical protein
VVSTALPVWKKLRTGAADGGWDGDAARGMEGNGNSDE